jgi:hypothetical protein
MHLAGRVLETPVVAYSVLIDIENALVIMQSIKTDLLALDRPLMTPRRREESRIL